MKRSLLIGIAGATIALGTVGSASATPLNLENPAAVADSGSSDTGSSAATSAIIGPLVSLLPTGSTAAMSNAIGAVATILLAPIGLLCSISSGGHGCLAGQSL
ncbi:MAG: hypothetical protein JWN03_523 [Nocardia sp.]|uniref:hypothetical protein n=1 Tax=Nocardia sp. TaxID=1821 RepID=UPI0026076E91|nr:hypothetical protein [Nocardia sp.]MCU1640248.1 hypothetical protein [Nocardia sp.]